MEKKSILLPGIVLLSVLGASFLGYLISTPSLAMTVVSAASPVYPYGPDHHLRASTSITFTPVSTLYLPIVVYPATRPPCAIYQLDDFSDPGSGWPTGYLSPYVYTQYISGEYNVHYGNLNMDGGRRFFNGWKADKFRLEVDVRQSEENDFFYGLVFGQDQNTQVFDFYCLSINSHTGEYSLIRWSQNPDNVKGLAYGNSDAIRPGTAINHLAVERVGDRITFWFNGIKAGEVYDNMFTGNRLVGLATDTLPTSALTADVYFDNFTLCTYAQ